MKNDSIASEPGLLPSSQLYWHSTHTIDFKVLHACTHQSFLLNPFMFLTGEYRILFCLAAVETNVLGKETLSSIKSKC